ncbi:MAG: DUF554 domain-containing protein [Erysipelotrichaceae bacterium]
MIGIGTLVNMGSILLGSAIGILFHGGLKEKYQKILMQVLGLAVIFIGISGALKEMFVIDNQVLTTQGTMMMIIALVLGSLLGEWIDIELRTQHFGEWLQLKVKGKGNDHFVEGFVTTSLITCVGAMAIVGPLQDGLYGDPSMLFIKATLDFITALIFSSTLGIGVMFALIPLGIYQGGITLFASALSPIMNPTMISSLSFIGSILIFALGVNMAFKTNLKVGNMLPALLIICILNLIKL